MIKLRHFLLIFLSLLLFFSFFCFYGMYWQNHLLKICKPIAVQVVSQKLEVSENLKYGPRFFPIITYTYQIRDHSYTGNQIHTPIAPWNFIVPTFWNRSDLNFKDENSARRYMAQHKIGQTILAYGDPAHPEQAFLEKFDGYTPSRLFAQYVLAVITFALASLVIDLIYNRIQGRN